MLKLLVADDHPIFRKGMIDVIKEEIKDVEIDEAKDGKEAMSLVKTTEYDVAVLDIDMPEYTGLDICREVSNTGIDTKVIVLTMHKDVHLLKEALSYNASGYIVKDNSVLEIINCIFMALDGKQYFSPSLQEDLKKNLSEENELIKSLESLSDSELNTLKMVSNRLSTKEIAEKLFVTPKSVENYRSRICKKIGLEGKNNALLVWSIENKEVINSYQK